jgi:hypothetical protein
VELPPCVRDCQEYLSWLCAMMHFMHHSVLLAQWSAEVRHTLTPCPTLISTVNTKVPIHCHRCYHALLVHSCCLRILSAYYVHSDSNPATVGRIATLAAVPPFLRLTSAYLLLSQYPGRKLVLILTFYIDFGICCGEY